MNLLKIFKPLIKNENIWKSHALYILAEYFFQKMKNKNLKEFFEKILEIEKSNPQIKLEAQKRLKEILVIKNFFIYLFFFLITNCSLDTKSKFWSKPQKIEEKMII